MDIDISTATVELSTHTDDNGSDSVSIVDRLKSLKSSRTMAIENFQLEDSEENVES